LLSSEIQVVAISCSLAYSFDRRADDISFFHLISSAAIKTIARRAGGTAIFDIVIHIISDAMTEEYDDIPGM